MYLNAGQVKAHKIVEAKKDSFARKVLYEDGIMLWTTTLPISIQVTPSVDPDAFSEIGIAVLFQKGLRGESVLVPLDRGRLPSAEALLRDRLFDLHSFFGFVGFRDAYVAAVSYVLNTEATIRFHKGFFDGRRFTQVSLTFAGDKCFALLDPVDRISEYLFLLRNDPP